MSQPQSLHANVCAVVLAGGRGSRMGGVDKGLQAFAGRPLVQHALERLQMQTGGAPGLIAVNANRNLPSYEAMGLAVWPDATADFAGPLAGFQTALSHLAALATSGQKFDCLLTVPCDSPRFPLDLLQRLHSSMLAQGAEMAVALAPHASSDARVVMRAQPVFSLMRCDLQDSLQRYLDSGERKIDAWLRQHRLASVAFDLPHDCANAFANVNTLEELRMLEQQ